MSRLRNIISLCMVGIATLAMLTACDDDYQPDLSQPITIVKSSLLFDPPAGVGTVEVRANGPITAELPYDWCEAQVDGQVITVSVADNTTFEGRTALLTIRCNGDQLQIPVQQRGMALGSMSVEACHVSNAGAHLSYYIRHDLPMNLQCDDEWVHARMDGDSLIIDIDANDVWTLRRSVLAYECAGYEGELAITQYDKAYILGEYYFGGEMSGAATGFRFYLKEVNGKFYMEYFTVDSWKGKLLPVDFDEDRCVITFHSQTVIAQRSSSFDAFYFYTAEGKLAESTIATMKAELYYNPIWRSHYATLEDGGTWSDGPLVGYLCLTYNTLMGPYTLLQLSNPYIVYLGPIKDE